MPAASARKKPLVFKRRAGPVSATPTAFLDSDSDSDPSTAPKPPKPTAADTDNRGGVDLFRRAKQFFPRAIEENSKRIQAEKQRIQQSPTDATERTPVSTPEPEDHSVKRRKVLSETPEGDERKSIRTTHSPPALGWNRSRTSRSPSTSPLGDSPRPSTGAGGKGKGLATPHTVNSQIVFTNRSPTSVVTADESLVLLEDGPTDERPDIDAAIAGIKEEMREIQAKAETKAEDDCLLVETKVKDETRDGDKSKANIGDDDDEDVLDTVNPEFNEYIMRAQALDAAARAAQALRESAGSGAVATRQTPEADASGATGTTTATLSRAATVSSARSTPAPSGFSYQNYRIFITANFPDSVPPLIATMRMDQKIHFVQTAFLSHARKKGANLPDDDDQFVLTWKGIKIYSWMTGQSLEIHPDAHGKFRDDLAFRQPSGFMSGGLHLEIWTRDLYEQHSKDQEKRRQRILEGVVDLDDLDSGSEGGGYEGSATVGRDGTHEYEAGTPGGSSAAAAAAASQQRIRLVLKSRDYEKLNMTAHADTKVETLIAAFREQRKIAPDKTISIHWDGDRLDENMTVEEAEMEDMDNIEVFIH